MTCRFGCICLPAVGRHFLAAGYELWWENTHTHILYIYIQIGSSHLVGLVTRYSFSKLSRSVQISSHQTGEAAMCGPGAGRFFGGFTGREIHGYMAGCFVPISAFASTRCLTGLLDLENKDNALFFFLQYKWGIRSLKNRRPRGTSRKRQSVGDRASGPMPSSSHYSASVCACGLSQRNAAASQQNADAAQLSRRRSTAFLQLSGQTEASQLRPGK